MREKSGFVLVLLMVILQTFYALYAYIDPAAFSVLRGTQLAESSDSDWVQIYASRTLFVSLIIGTLLYFRAYKVLMWAALLGTVMPLTDGYLAYQAQAPFGVVAKHLATVLYLVITSVVLSKILANEKT